MDTITLAGPLEAKLRAVREAGFSQIMLSARDLVGHPDGEAAAVAAVRDERPARHRLPGAARLRRPVRATCTTTRSTSPSRCSRWPRRSRAPLLLVCSTTSAHAIDDLDAQVARPAQARDARRAARHPHRLRRPVVGPLRRRVPGAWALVGAADRANLGLAIDSFHLLAKDTPLDVLDEIDPAKLFLVQLSDFMWSAPRTPEERRETARHLRVFPGEGAHSEAVADLIRAIDRHGLRGRLQLRGVQRRLRADAARPRDRRVRAARWTGSPATCRDAACRCGARSRPRPDGAPSSGAHGLMGCAIRALPRVQRA